MHLNIPYLVAALGLATTASADSMRVSTSCNQWGHCTYSGQFTTANGVYGVNGAGGCRSTSVPGMTELCVDWGKRRAHFKFQGQTGKHCLSITSEKTAACGTSICTTSYFTPVGCTW